MLNPRELATVLAALRHWQEALAFHGPEFAESFPHFHDESPLTRSEIDDLCQSLNFGDAANRQAGQIAL